MGAAPRPGRRPGATGACAPRPGPGRWRRRANPDEDLELKRIYLLGRYQGNGAGKRLLAQAVEFARAAGAVRLLLGVYAGNEAALGFYLKQSFAQVAERTFRVGGKAYDDHVLALRLGT